MDGITEQEQQTDPSASLAGAKPCVGVLFVHGAGDHAIGSTLIEFGQPLISWLDGWLSHGVEGPTSATDAARPGATQILVREADSHAPAHAELALRSSRGGTPHVWLLAESRWDEAFKPPGFQQVLLWALGVVPWTVLTQFIGPLIDESRLLRADVVSILRFFWNIAVSAALALVAAVILQLFALAILVLSIIPLDPVRGLVGSVQRFASSSVGDLYMVLTSPVERAALTSAVQRDIDWLRAQGCERIAVVAHSQGGYVAYQALADPWHRDVDKLITFGSGLIRLTESEQARRTGVLRTALVGVLGALVAIRFAPVAVLGTLGIWEKHQASDLAFVVGIALSLALIVTIRRYLKDRIVVPDLPTATPTPWVDYVTNEDPVLNGSRENRLPDRVQKIRIENRASVVADHGAYWQNSDQFVSRVAMELGALDASLELLEAGPIASEHAATAHLERSWERRRERVAALDRARGPLALATAALLAIRFGELDSVGRPIADLTTWVPAQVVAWLPDVVRSILPIALSNLTMLGAATILALSLVGYKIGVGFWNAWGQTETVDQWRGVPPNEQSLSAIMFYAWTILQLVVVALVAIVGPSAIVRGSGDLWTQRDPIVQAWARHYLPSITLGVLVALVVVFGDRARAGGRIRRIVDALAVVSDRLWPNGLTLRSIVAATAVTMVFELALAMVTPGETAAAITIPVGVAAEAIALVAIDPASKVLLRRFCQLTEWVQCRVPTPMKGGAKASRLDRVGVLGLIGTVIGALLVAYNTTMPILVGSLFAFAGLMLTAILAANPTDRELPLLGKPPPSPTDLRIVGALGAVASVVVLLMGARAIVGVITGTG